MEHEIKYAFRMVHIENIPHVLEYGFVHKDSCNADPNYIPIGDTSVIRVREERAVIGEKTIGQYIPFYFGPRSPMLYVVQHGYNGVRQYDAENLVCLIWIVLYTCMNHQIQRERTAFRGKRENIRC